MTERKVYRFDIESKHDENEFQIDATAITEAASAKKAHLAINEQAFADLATPYVEWRQSLSSGFGSFFRAKLRTPAAVALCRRNSKFVLALMKLMGLDALDRFSLSLDMLAHKSVVRALLDVMTRRRVKASRNYQVLGEVKHMVAYVLETAHAHLNVKERAGVKMSAFEAFNLVVSQLRECQIDKNQQASQRAALDELDLISMGKILDEKELAHLRAKVEDYLSKPVPDKITKSDCFTFQSFLVTYLLSSGVIPCVRQQVMVALKIGSSFRFSEDDRQYLIDMPPFGKTKSPLFIKFPRTETGLLRKWLEEYRPVLLDKVQDHHYLFLSESGQARKEVSSMVKSVQMAILAKAAPVHSFRHMQCIESARVGITEQEHKAMSAGRQHKPQTADLFYAKHNRKRQSELAESHLAQVRAARGRAQASASASPPAKRARVEPTEPKTAGAARSTLSLAENDDDGAMVDAVDAVGLSPRPKGVKHEPEVEERKYAHAEEPDADAEPVKIKSELHPAEPVVVVKPEPGVGGSTTASAGAGAALRGGKSKQSAIVID